MNQEISNTNNQLFLDIKQLIDKTRLGVSQTINVGLTMLYWNIGKRINDEILNNKRADYGKQIISILGKQLEEQYGKGFSVKNLRRMMQFYEVFSDKQIVASLLRQLSWTHFTLLIPIKDELQRDFYAQMCRFENWSVRTGLFAKKLMRCYLNALPFLKSPKIWQN